MQQSLKDKTIVIALKPCPDEEGIKTRLYNLIFPSNLPLKPCPDEEGIKTSFQKHIFLQNKALKPCPDEEGIKTDQIYLMSCSLRL